MACGLPLLATHYSGQTQYLDAFPDAIVSIDFELAPLIDPDYQQLYGKIYDGKSMGLWAVPDVSSIKSGMIRIRQEFDHWRGRALNNVGQIRSQYDWHSIARLAIAALER